MGSQQNHKQQLLSRNKGSNSNAKYLSIKLGKG